MRLHQIAHCRTGDKGNISNISVIVYNRADYDLLRTTLTSQQVAMRFANIASGPVERYELPQLGALNFVLHNALGGGVTRSLALDAHGKCLASAMLDIEIPDFR
jgi:hypothetical protein|tara:strand:+ start:14 stop:325 length:312 start_codon:yes stop_codon:yes gene_type:complete